MGYQFGGLDFPPLAAGSSSWGQLERAALFLPPSAMLWCLLLHLSGSALAGSNWRGWSLTSHHPEGRADIPLRWGGADTSDCPTVGGSLGPLLAPGLVGRGDFRRALLCALPKDVIFRAT